MSNYKTSTPEAEGERSQVKMHKMGLIQPPMPIIPDSPCIMCREGSHHTQCENMIADWTEQDGERLTVKEFEAKAQARTGRTTKPWRRERAEKHRARHDELASKGYTLLDIIKGISRESGLSEGTIRWDLHIAGVDGATGRHKQ